jgi:hypothetical protein
LLPSGAFQPPAGQPVGQAWLDFCTAALAGWDESRKTAGVVIMAPEAKQAMKQLVASWVGKSLPDHKLQTVLAFLAGVSSGGVGNALRAAQWDRETFLKVLLGDPTQTTFHPVASRRRLKRKRITEIVQPPDSTWFQSHVERLSVVLVSSDVGADEDFLPDTLSCQNAVRVAGYVVWVRSDPTLAVPRWWETLLYNYVHRASLTKVTKTYFVPAGESVLVDYAPSAAMRWRRLSFLQRVVKRASPRLINEVFAEPDLLRKKLRSSEAYAIEQLFRRLCAQRSGKGRAPKKLICSRGRWAFTLTSDRAFLAVLSEATRLADVRLAHPAASGTP